MKVSLYSFILMHVSFAFKYPVFQKAKYILQETFHTDLLFKSSQCLLQKTTKNILNTISYMQHSNDSVLVLNIFAFMSLPKYGIHCILHIPKC